MIKSIEAHARISFKQPTRSGDVFYTYEYSETRDLSEVSNIEEEKQKLWDDVNHEVERQIIQTKEMYKNS